MASKMFHMTLCSTANHSNNSIWEKNPKSITFVLQNKLLRVWL